MENRNCPVAIRTDEIQKEFLVAETKNFFFGNSSLCGHYIIKYANTHKEEFEKWLDSEMDKLRKSSDSLV